MMLLARRSENQSACSTEFQARTRAPCEARQVDFAVLKKIGDHAFTPSG
jgi:hypothetical protein